MQQFGVSSSVYSVTSYKALYQDARECERWNRLHPRRRTAASPTSARCWTADAGPDRGRLGLRQRRGDWRLRPGCGPDYVVLGTDGFGRSEARRELRRFFEVDAENIALAALAQLAA